MAAIEKQARVMIRRPRAEVFAFVANPGNYALWQPYVKEAKITSKGGFRLDATYQYTFQAAGSIIETQGKITEYALNNRYAFQSTDGPFPITGSFSFEDADGFTEVTASGEADPGGYFSMAKGILSLLLGRELNLSLRTLKEILEKG